MTALNPFLTVEEQLTEVTRLHLGHTHKQAVDHAIAMLERVGIPAASRRIFEYPHQFSGGMRQRVMIAMALACKPDLLIADEPTTALDVTIQAQILELLKELQEQEGTAVILITHDLGIVANICHRVMVMYGGRIVEESLTTSLFAQPRHPYTLGLLESVPRWDKHGGKELPAIEGQPPNPTDLPPGCPFEPRCPYRIPDCVKAMPPLFARPEGGRYACLVDVTTTAPHKHPAEEATNA
jgi:oligopeptide transport system ATP-binding protein